MIEPLVTEIAYETPLHLFARVKERKGAVFLESQMTSSEYGRYSFIAVDPFVFITTHQGETHWNGEKKEGNPFLLLKEALSQYALSVRPGYPPFQGGAAGFFSYEAIRYLESISLSESSFPDISLGLYDLVLGIDEFQKRAWIFSSGYPERDEVKRKKRAEERIAWLQSLLLGSFSFPTVSKKMIDSIVSNKTSHQYQTAVQKVKEYILEGDIFEANIAQSFKSTLLSTVSSFDLYCRLRNINPAPFAAFVSFEGGALVSASPERFLKVAGKKVEARPIKGTRPRGKTDIEDKIFMQALEMSEKDRAENVMIVDLLRNDLSRVCEDHSVKVSQLCGLETFAHVHHLVSVVEGTLRKECDAIDLVCASFPGGSITGAPKIRAMEIIAEIESQPRGPYCGSIGYLGFDGSMDLSIVIRTFVVQGQTVTFHAGGAVVLDSDPLNEYEESLIKARALIRALEEVSSHDFVD